MIRFFALAVLAITVAACQQTTAENNGSGPLVLSSKFAASINKASRDDEKKHFQLHVAIDNKGRNLYWFACPEPFPATCAPPKSEDFHKSSDELALGFCNRDGKFECSMYSRFREVAWDGPVYAMSTNRRMRQPFNGVWPITLRLNSDVPVEARLVGYDGDLFIEGMPGQKRCPAAFEIRKKRIGDLIVSCEEAKPVTMMFSVRGTTKDTLKGRSQDAGNKKVGFTLNFAAGKGRLGPRYD